jgi:hypothetical protein
MKKIWMIMMAVVVTLAVPALARAHEGHEHKALGTVSGVNGNHVTVKTTEGKTIVLMLDDKTTVTRGKEKLEAKAVTVGERVSVGYMEENKMLMAHEIKLATTPAAKK